MVAPDVSVSPETTLALSRLGYQLEGELGRGGMGVVYRARDLKHGRPVAVKLLRTDIATRVEATRFQHEIEVSARLAHPNILPVHDSGIAAGAPFFVTPLLEGRTLWDRLKTGPLPVDEAMRFGAEIANALAFAHAQGVIHRDIKPENILFQDGHAVVADFGIAKALSEAQRVPGARATFSADAGRLTQPGGALGTAAYMSPEQLSGEPVDARTDIYALGCVLYEMVAGASPFAGLSPPEVLARQLRVSPADLLRGKRSGGPLWPIVEKSLAVHPEDRYQTAGELANELREKGGPRRRSVTPLAWTVLIVVALGGGALVVSRIAETTLDPRRIVVTAPVDETGDAALATVGPRLRDLIVDGLSRMNGITVVTAERSVPSFRIESHPGRGPASNDDPLERLHALAVEAEAGTLVTGSYYRFRDSLELQIEITDARSGDLLRAVGPAHGKVEKVDSLVTAVQREVVTAVDSLRRVSR